MDVQRVRALFPDAEIDHEGFFTRDKRIMMDKGTDFGHHINVVSFSSEKFEALMYWYSHSDEFAAPSPQ